MYTEGVAKSRISIERLVQVLSENPARIFGLFPSKGQIAPGADGDIAVLDPRCPHTIGASMHHSNADYSLYEGWQSAASVIATIRRGQVLLDNGVLNEQAGPGRYLPGRAGTFRDATIQ
jgi:dihydropyrimidinase